MGDPSTPNASLRIVVLDHTGAVGGAELALLRLLDHIDADISVRTILFSDGPLARAIADAGHDVEVFPLSPQIAAAGREASGGTRITALVNAIRVLPYAVRLGLHLRRLDPDLIHTTSLKADLIGLVAARVAGRPMVWHIHDRISPDYLPMPLVTLVRRLARWAPSRVIVNSAGTAVTLPKAKGLTIAYPGFSPAQLGPSPHNRARPEPPVIGIVGRISPTKGQLSFVRAAAVVQARHPGARFRIVGAPLFGEDAYEARVKAEVEKLGMTDAVEFTGFLEDPTAELDRMSVCVHASGQPEPFGQVIVEAMARGVPVVATRGGGVTEIVHPSPEIEPFGWLVPRDDVDALAEAIIAVLDQPEVALSRALAAWREVQERFSIIRTADAIQTVWRDAARPPLAEAPAAGVDPDRADAEDTGTGDTDVVAPAPAPAHLRPSV